MRIPRIALAVLAFAPGLSAQSAASQGIYVGEPKVYDNRTLSVMLEELNAQLARISVLDQAKLTAALGTLQGMEVRETSTGTTIGIARPYTTSKTEGDKLTKTEVVPDPKIPWNMDLGAMNTIGPSSPNYGFAAQDLLGDQVNLQYQIFNLRMMLDRSLTDRIHGQQTKLTAVLGIPVSLDPSRQAVDSAAIVSVRVRRADRVNCPPGPACVSRPVSVVALMPQEKTYNSAALSRKSNAFGASAVAKVVQVGFSSVRRGQTYFLYRDNDTTAFQEYTPTETVFGWQFRPVLGRRSVAAGPRQMFAVIALPEGDLEAHEYDLEVSVETRWAKYQRAELTTYPKSLWFESFGGLIGKPVPPPRQSSRASQWWVSVPTTEFYQNNLRPRVSHVSWSWVGKRDVLVSVEGQNFFSDTRVLMGGKSFDSSNGFRIKSERAFELLVDGSQLFDAVMQGRYGTAVPLIREDPGGTVPIRIEKIEWRPAVEGFSTVLIYLGRPGADLWLSDLPRALSKQPALPKGSKAPDLLEPQVLLNDTLLPGPHQPYDIQPRGCCHQVLLSVLVSKDVVGRKDGLVTVRYPFWGAGWKDQLKVDDENKYFSLGRLKTDGAATWFLLTDKNRSFNSGSHLSVLTTSGTHYPLKAMDKCDQSSAIWLCFEDRDTALLRADEAVLGERLLLRDDDRLYSVEIPPKQPKPAPDKKVPEVQQYDSVWLTLEFARAKVSRVEVDGQPLRLRPNDKQTDVLVGRELTQKPGNLDLTVYAPPDQGKDDMVGKVVRIRVVCRECDPKEVKK